MAIRGTGSNFALETGTTLVAVLCGGRSSEREISLQSGRAVLGALRSAGHRVVEIDVGHDICAQLSAAKPDVAFIALHGAWGEDGCIQGALELLGIPYTGSGVRASAIALDKVTTKRLFVAAELPTPAWRYPARAEDIAELGLPLVLKPPTEGSSVGLEIVSEADRAKELLLAAPGVLMAEAYVPGRELTVAVLGSGSEARVLGVLEVCAASGNYDYDAKYLRDDTRYLVPAPIPAAVEGRVGNLALEAHRLLGCAGASRVDFRWDGERGREPMLLEVNTLPGMTDHSLLPKIAAHAGLSYLQLVEALLSDARLHVLG